MDKSFSLPHEDKYVQLRQICEEALKDLKGRDTKKKSSFCGCVSDTNSKIHVLIERFIPLINNKLSNEDLIYFKKECIKNFKADQTTTDQATKDAYHSIFREIDVLNREFPPPPPPSPSSSPSQKFYGPGVPDEDVYFDGDGEMFKVSRGESPSAQAEEAAYSPATSSEKRPSSTKDLIDTPRSGVPKSGKFNKEIPHQVDDT